MTNPEATQTAQAESYVIDHSNMHFAYKFPVDAFAEKTSRLAFFGASFSDPKTGNIGYVVGTGIEAVRELIPNDITRWTEEDFLNGHVQHVVRPEGSENALVLG